MGLKIFNEKSLNKINDESEETASEIFKEGEKGLSLSKIISTRNEDLEDLIFEINTDDFKDEEDS